MTTPVSEATRPLPPETVRFLAWLVVENGYMNVDLLPDGRWVAIRHLAFTHAIIVGDVGDRFSVGDRWCYRSYLDALLALATWNGTGEPAGWHRHPYSGRRVADDGTVSVRA